MRSRRSTSVRFAQSDSPEKSLCRFYSGLGPLGDALLRHAISDDAGRRVLGVGAVENLAQGVSDAKCAGLDFALVPAIYLPRHADDATAVEDVVGCIEDPAIHQHTAMLGARELVVGGACDHARVQPR